MVQLPQAWGKKLPEVMRPQSTRVLCELLPKQAWSADELLRWLRETQTRNART